MVFPQTEPILFCVWVLQTFICLSLILKLLYVFGCFLSPTKKSLLALFSFPTYSLGPAYVLVFLSLMSIPFSFSFLGCTCPAGRGLQPATLPFPHHAFPPVELMGNAVFPPSLLPPAPSSPASLSCIAQWWKKPFMKRTLAKRGAEQTQVISVCVFYCLPVPASRHSAFEAEYSWESVERFILERGVVDWHSISLFKRDCYPYAGDHMWLTAPALCFLSFSAQPPVHIFVVIFTMGRGRNCVPFRTESLG